MKIKWFLLTFISLYFPNNPVYLLDIGKKDKKDVFRFIQEMENESNKNEIQLTFKQKLELEKVNNFSLIICVEKFVKISITVMKKLENAYIKAFFQCILQN